MRLAILLPPLLLILAGCSGTSQDTNKVASNPTGTESTQRRDQTNLTTPTTPATPTQVPTETPAEALNALVKAGGRVSPDEHDPKQPLAIDLGAVPDPVAALKHVAVLPDVRSLTFGLNKVPLAPSAYPLFESLKHLEDLDLNSTGFTDAGLAHLKGLTQLKKLALDHDPVTNAGVVYLKGLPNLEILSLSSTEVDDAGLDVFKEFPRLTSLDLRVSKVRSDANVAELRKALPKVMILK